MIGIVFGIEIQEGAQKLKDTEGMVDHENFPRKGVALHSAELIERALWEIAAHGGNVSKACASLAEQGIVRSDGEPIKRTTMAAWKRKSHRNRYNEILRTRVNDIDEVLAQAAQANALELGEGMAQALQVTLGGLANSNGVEASTILRNMSQARSMEIDNADQLRRRDAASRNADSMERLVAEITAIAGPNVVKVRNEDEETGVLDPDFRHELPAEIQREVDAVSAAAVPGARAEAGNRTAFEAEVVGDDDDPVAP